MLLLPLVLTGCGSEVVGGAQVDRAELEKRAGESALEHVYVTEIPGFTLAEQSVNVIGHDGFSATYFSQRGGQVQLAVDREKLPANGCDGCVRDGDHWYSSTSGGSVYLRAEGGHVVRLTGSGGVPRDVVRTAAEKAHHAGPEEMDAVLPKARSGAAGGASTEGPAGGGTSTGGGPVERGDLPPVGDGAPRNDVGVSG
ncbi:hypothetical protein [Streptomyces candidus]|uniref:Uncharacterized protein n=1 Tax=Streptomyces candidus TaxID=67283 RepID=A0A7X0HF73_9ACTN|nr:hypothetical protein [Streptomyces candidus]MBB6436520.1 hypothetical protein [Streptomyces candidus]GHH49257.1 membrane protein [Streptomyces candidus]